MGRSDRHTSRSVDDETAEEGLNEVIRLQGRIRSIIAQIREIEAGQDRSLKGGDREDHPSQPDHYNTPTDEYKALNLYDVETLDITRG